MFFRKTAAAILLVYIVCSASTCTHNKPQTYKELLYNYRFEDSAVKISPYVMAKYLPAEKVRNFHSFYSGYYCRTNSWALFEVEASNRERDSAFKLVLAFKDSLLADYRFYYTDRIDAVPGTDFYKVVAYCGRAGIFTCMKTYAQVHYISFDPYLCDTMRSGPFELRNARNVKEDSVVYRDN